jgi:hypothetical protein
MPTPFSVAGRLMAALELRSMPVSEFAVLTGKEKIPAASKTKLNEYFRDAASMPHATEERCWALWTEIETLCRSVQPLALDLSNGFRVHEWLLAQRAEQLQIAVIIGELPQRSAFLTGVLAALGGDQQ